MIKAIKEIIKKWKIDYYENWYIENNQVWNIYMDLLFNMKQNNRIVKEEQEKIEKVEKIIDKIDKRKEKIIDKIYKNI